MGGVGWGHKRFAEPSRNLHGAYESKLQQPGLFYHYVLISAYLFYDVPCLVKTGHHELCKPTRTLTSCDQRPLSNNVSTKHLVIRLFIHRLSSWYCVQNVTKNPYGRYTRSQMLQADQEIEENSRSYQISYVWGHVDDVPLNGTCSAYDFDTFGTYLAHWDMFGAY